MKKTWRVIVTLAVLLSVLLILYCSLLHEQDHFRFVFMTDIHLQPELNGDLGFEQAIRHVNKMSPRPAFVITGGDLIMDALGVSYGRADSLYRLFEEKAALFNMPVFHAIGNHEHFGVYPSSGVMPDHPFYGKKMFEERLGDGKTYHSFTHGRWHFILLDGIGITPEREYVGHIDSVQIAWLKSDLAATGTKTPVVLVSHIPLISVAEQIYQGPTTPNLPYLVVVNADEVLDLCRPYNVRLILQGHLHIVEEMTWKDLHFITGGAVCGKWWNGPNHGFDEGFVAVDIAGDDFSWSYESFGWEAVTP